MLSILCVRLTIKVKVGIPESFKVGWYPLKKTGSSHLKSLGNRALATYTTVQFSRSLHISFLEPLYNKLINTEELRKRLFI